MQGHESPRKITVCNGHLLLLSCLVITCLNSPFRKGVPKDRATHGNPLFILFAQAFLRVCMHMCTRARVHRHTHTHTLWTPKENMALLLLFISIKSTIKIYPSISDILPIKILYTSLCNVLVSFLTSQEYFKRKVIVIIVWNSNFLLFQPYLSYSEPLLGYRPK